MFHIIAGAIRKRQETDMPTLPIRPTIAAVALGLLAAPALAQSTAPATSAPATSQPTSSAPAASQPAPDNGAAQSAAPSASTGSNANASVAPTAELKAGMTVKDKTGASIGQIASVDTDSKTGQKMATIKMGKDSFRLQADRLGVDNGAATINLTQADIQSQLHPKTQ